MKTVFLLIFLLSLTGCANLTNLEKVLAKDQATVIVSITTLYGNVKLTRIGGVPTNTVETVSPDGSVTIKQP